MKTILFIFLFIPSVLFSQNVIYFVMQPADFGLGVRYDKTWKGKGFYTAIAKGNYSLPEAYIKDHLKGTLGFVYKYATLGVSYHKFGETKGEINYKAFDKVSGEFGFRTSVNRFSCAIRYDPIKFEGSWDIGFNF